MGILWTIIMGAVVGAIAKFVMPGSNEPKGFILTAALGIAGSLLAGFWVRPLVGIVLAKVRDFLARLSAPSS